MSEQQIQVQQVFKEYKVLTANSAVQIGLSVTAMLLLGQGWQIYGQLTCTPKGDGVEYSQALLHYEYVTTPVTPPASEIN
jgi:hypothetical protein